MLIKKSIGTVWQLTTNFFTKGHQRSLEAKKNIVGSLLIKGVSIAVGLVLVPLTIHYINPSQYGIWLTLSSLIAWISFFDIGFTHGLRNKFAAAKAKGDTIVARIYISTTYYYIGIIFFILWLLLMMVNHFISWHTLLNLAPEMEPEVSKLAILIFSYFCFQFVFRIINTILIADQQPAKASLLDMLGQLFSLAIIFLLTRFTKGSLLNLGLAVGIAPTIILISANFFLFNSKYKLYKPSIKFVKKEYARDIMKLGVKFFVLQIAAIIQFESSLFLIAHYFLPIEVTNYNIAYKYFSVLQMVFMILLSPLWSGVTEAYNSGDHEWIKNAMKKYLLLVVPFVLTGLIMLAFSARIYELWVGKNVVHISFTISVLFLVFFTTGIFASVFVAIINGIGALRLQFITSLISSVSFFIMFFVLMRYFNMGVKSVIIASILSNFFGYIVAPIQVYNIFYKKALAKIWYR